MKPGSPHALLPPFSFIILFFKEDAVEAHPEPHRERRGSASVQGIREAISSCYRAAIF